MPIRILTEDAYRGFLEEPTSKGMQNMHIAQVCFADGEIHRAYVKIYPENSHELVNEITGHLLAKAAGLGTPDRAAIIFVPKDALMTPPDWVDCVPGDNVIGWCTQDMAYPSIRFFYDLNDFLIVKKLPITLPAIAEELLKSKQIPAVIAFDDWVANVDRNLGNLLRLGKGNYLLIDHGEIFGAVDWHPASLAHSETQYLNKLRNLLDTHGKTKLDVNNLATLSRDRHHVALVGACPYLLDLWCLLMNNEEMEAAAAFLDNRVKPDNICKRYQVILI